MHYFSLHLRWQGKTEEKFWCIQCTQSNCSKGSGVRVDKCDREDERQQFYYDDGRIRSKKDHSMCFERRGRSIELDSCSKSINQKVQYLELTLRFSCSYFFHGSNYCILLVAFYLTVGRTVQNTGISIKDS